MMIFPKKSIKITFPKMVKNITFCTSLHQLLSICDLFPLSLMEMWQVGSKEGGNYKRVKKNSEIEAKFDGFLK